METGNSLSISVRKLLHKFQFSRKKNMASHRFKFRTCNRAEVELLLKIRTKDRCLRAISKISIGGTNGRQVV